MKKLLSIRQSLATRFILYFIVGILLMLIPTMGVLFYLVRDNLRNGIRDEATLLCQFTVAQFEQAFLEWEAAGKIMVAHFSRVDGDLTMAEIRESMDDALQAVSDIRTAVVVFEPGVLPELSGKPFMMVRYRDGAEMFSEGPVFLNDTRYLEVKAAGKALWLEPFQVKDDFIACYASPIYRSDANGVKQFVGVACVEVSCAWLQEQVDLIHPQGEGYAFLLTRGQYVLACDNKQNLGKNLIDLPYRTDANFDEFSSSLKNGLPRDIIAQSEETGECLHLFFQVMRSTGWSFALVFPEARMNILLNAFHHTFTIMIVEALVVMILIALSMYFRFSTPLRKVMHFASEIGRGKLTEPAPKVSGKDEIAMLAATIDNMRNSLQEYIASIQTMTKAQERTANELEIANRIQLGILPDHASQLFSQREFGVSAAMSPAKEVGGDLYDVSLIAPNKLCIVIGDVSGKGIPAAMLMVVTQTLQRGMVHGGDCSPKKVVAKLNDILSAYKKMNFFVTYLMGILDLESGVFTYCNAGHNPFLVLKKDGTVATPCRRNGIPVGVKAHYEYTEAQCTLDHGDAILLYTDGVVDAENAQHQFFGMGRLKAIAEECASKNCSAEEVGEAIVHGVASFSEKCDQHDDMTYLCVKRKEL